LLYIKLFSMQIKKLSVQSLRLSEQLLCVYDIFFYG